MTKCIDCKKEFEGFHACEKSDNTLLDWQIKLEEFMEFIGL